MSKKTIVAFIFFTLEKIPKEVIYHTICVKYKAKIEAGAGGGNGVEPKLWLQPNTRYGRLWLRNPASHCTYFPRGK